MNMDVFLVPLAADRYELYCEVPDEPHDAADAAPRSRFQRIKHYFSVMLAEAEHERRHGPSAPATGWLGRLRAKTMRWVAEAVAEQRLLWHMRRQASATLFFPDDMTEAAAVDLLRRQLARDFDRHRFWLAIDSLLFVGSGVLFFVPGPNVVAYYFAFRMVGHYFSLRGARHGLQVVSWMNEPSAPLAALRAAVAMEPGPREQRVQDLADELRLEHLPRFIERTAVYFSS
jgi:hypothetical protein